MEYILRDNTKLFAVNYDAETVSTIHELAKENPDSTIRIMPDYHGGKGCVIGTTMTIHDKVNPNHVGVDIGCGVTGVMFKETEVDFAELDAFIKETIPSGKNRRTSGECVIPLPEKEEIRVICEKIGIDYEDVLNSCGTLGGGNHYIELGSLDGTYLLTVHSGSRYFGKSICDYHSRKANGGYLTGDDMKEYYHDMNVAVTYAERNRRQMLNEIVHNFFKIPRSNSIYIINTVHNYWSADGVLRKGAIRANKGESLLIPLNMRDGVIYGLGKGNPDWNNSAPHGAGRLFSRGEAKRTIALEDFEKSMEGIYSSCVGTSTIDESPMAYKDGAEIFACIEPTVHAIGIAKPLYNFKGV